jgi:hypothetical protein
MNSESNATFGTIRFSTKQEALEALVLANHCYIKPKGIIDFDHLACSSLVLFLYVLFFHSI